MLSMTLPETTWSRLSGIWPREYEGEEARRGKAGDGPLAVSV